MLQVLREFKPQNEEKKSESKIWWEDSDAEDDDDITIDIPEKRNNFYSHTSLLCGIVFVEKGYISINIFVVNVIFLIM